MAAWVIAEAHTANSFEIRDFSAFHLGRNRQIWTQLLPQLLPRPKQSIRQRARAQGKSALRICLPGFSL